MGFVLEAKAALIRPSATFSGPRVRGEGGRSVVPLRGQRRYLECLRFWVDARIPRAQSSVVRVQHSALRAQSSVVRVQNLAFRAWISVVRVQLRKEVRLK